MCLVGQGGLNDTFARLLPEMSDYLPLEICDKSVGNKVLIVMKNGSEFEAVLDGFDEYVNVVLHDVVEYNVRPIGVQNSQSTWSRDCPVESCEVIPFAAGICFLS